MNDAQVFLQSAAAGVFALLLSAACSDTTQAATLYKWTDESGGVHYSNSVPNGRKGVRVDGGNISIIPGPPLTEPAPPLSAAGDAERDQRTAIEQALAERRDTLIRECERNRGVDCARQVDTELDAQRIQASGHVIHQARPAPR